MSKNTKEIELSMMIVVPDDVSEAVLLDQFIDWADSKEYTCGGMVKEYVEPMVITEITQNEDHLKQILNIIFQFEIDDLNKVKVKPYDNYINFSLYGTNVELHNSGIVFSSDEIKFNVFKLVSKLNSLGYDI